MRKVKAIIKDVEKTKRSQAYLFELRREGVEIDDIIEGSLNLESRGIQFSKNGSDCVAWIGCNCELLRSVPIDKVKPGMIFFQKSNPKKEVVVITVNNQKVTIQDKTEQIDMPYSEDEFCFIRSLSNDEFENFMSNFAK